MVMKEPLGFARAMEALRGLKLASSDPAAGGEAAGEAASEEGVTALREAARAVARMEVADAVTEALNAYDGSLRDLQKASGLDPAFVSKLASGRVNKQGATVASLAQIALAMNKTLKITIE